MASGLHLLLHLSVETGGDGVSREPLISEEIQNFEGLEVSFPICSRDDYRTEVSGRHLNLDGGTLADVRMNFQPSAQQ